MSEWISNQTDNKPLIITVVQWVKSTQTHLVKGLLHPSDYKCLSYLASQLRRLMSSAGGKSAFGSIHPDLEPFLQPLQ